MRNKFMGASGLVVSLFCLFLALGAFVNWRKAGSRSFDGVMTVVLTSAGLWGTRASWRRLRRPALPSAAERPQAVLSLAASQGGVVTAAQAAQRCGINQEGAVRLLDEMAFAGQLSRQDGTYLKR